MFTGEIDHSDQRQSSLRRAHSAFLESGTLTAGLRPVVAESWLRSAAAGLDAEHSLAPVALGGPELVDYRAEHRLSRVFPLLYDILGSVAEDCDCVMALGDAEGQLLWVCGNPTALRMAEGINFVEGAVWNEHRAGTNAPGTALRLDAPVVIRAAEHFNRLVQPWSCAAAPIHDPATQAVLGILDITGGEDVASPQTLGMVRAAARMAEVELARISAVEAAMSLGAARTNGRATRARPVDRALTIQALGRPDCAVSIAGRSVRLSPRHSEILVLLAERPGGLTGEELEVELYAADVHRSTMRAEMTRLRALLGNDVLESRPYRLTAAVDGDWRSTAAHLAHGRLREAVQAYRGPLLPHSESPGVVEIRERLHGQLRAALLASTRPDLMLAWTRTRWGRDDLALWRRQADLLPTDAPLRTMAAAETARLDRLHGLTAH